MQVDNKHHLEVSFRNGFRDAVKLRPEILEEMEVKINPFPFKAKELMEEGHTEFIDGFGYSISLEYERYGREIKLYASCDDFNTQLTFHFFENKTDSEDKTKEFAELLGKNTYECICKLMDEIEEQGGFEYEDDTKDVSEPVVVSVEPTKPSKKSERYNDIYVEDFCVGFRKVDKDKLKWKYELRDLRTFMDIPKLLEERYIKFVSRAGDKIAVTIKIEYTSWGAEYRVNVHRNNWYDYEYGSLDENKCKNKNHFFHCLSKAIGFCMGKAMLGA